MGRGWDLRVGFGDHIRKGESLWAGAEAQTGDPEGRRRGSEVGKTRQGPGPFNQFPFLLPPRGGHLPLSDMAG